MSLEINYIDAPDGAQENMNAVGENGNALSDTSLIATGAQKGPYATLEPGIWKLDGTMKIIPDKPELGWWSVERSGEDCSISAVPKITLSFPSSYSTTAFTFRFSPETDQWCSEIHARFYSNQSMILEKTYYPNAAVWMLLESIENFDSAEFELLKTNKPGHFAKIQRIEIGKTVLLSAEEIVKARLVNEIDHSLCELTVDTMEFEMNDPQGRDFLPQENQRVELIQNGKLIASQYIKSSTRNAKSNYTISCQSAIGLLNDEYLGGIYEQKPLDELVSEILGSWEYEIAPEFESITVTGYLPVCSQREALQQVSFAIGALISTQDSRKIRFVPVPTATSARFTESDIMLGGSVKTVTRYARVEVNSHTYTKTDDVETLMDAEEVTGENVMITFNAPHYDYEITNGTLVDSGVNWVKITAYGQVTLTGKPYLHSVRSHVKRNQEATAKEQGNYIAVTDCTLINSGNAQSALKRLYDSKQWRQTTNQNVIVTNQKAGQIVSSLTPWGSISKGYIASMDSTLTQKGHVASIQIRGVEITLESVWLYSGEIYSGGQEVLY